MGREMRIARVVVRLPNRPVMTFVTVTIELLVALAMRRIDIDLGRRRGRFRPGAAAGSAPGCAGGDAAGIRERDASQGEHHGNEKSKT